MIQTTMQTANEMERLSESDKRQVHVMNYAFGWWNANLLKTRAKNV